MSDPTKPFTSNEFTRSDYADTLNALCVMQDSIIYAARRKVLNDAERIIVQLEERLRAVATPAAPTGAAPSPKLDSVDKAQALRDEGSACEAQARDAARYRWLRAGNYSIGLARSILNDAPEGIDKSVDAAMQETP